ncbi:MAG: hypothetical protein O2822_01965 [Chloroflexi bacterium]|nr:hypothetical protein [Chloroflexota bacterium]
MTIASGPLAREAELEVMQFFAERIARPVSIDVWTRRDTGLVLPDRDTSLHDQQQLALMRQFVRLSPLISVTPYDVERHADRAAEARVDLTPMTVLRCGGRSVQYLGMAGGLLFPAFLDVMSYLSVGTTPLDESSREVLATLREPVQLELLVAPYDNYSAHLMRLASALAVECRMVRLRIVDATEYPIFASLRAVSGVPVLSINGQRFMGVWDETELVEQIRRIEASDTEPVARSTVYATPFITEAEARAMEAESAAEVVSAMAPAPSGGLYIPGRD